MPLIVDHDAVKQRIIMAFEGCLREKPITKITLRDIAKAADMPHSTLLYYFKNKNELIYTYVKYTNDFMSSRCVAWFDGHPRENYATNLDYMNAFMEYVATGRAGENRPNGTTQTYVLAHYDGKIAQLVQEEFREWRRTMEACLKRVYGDKAGAKEAEAMMILISGTFICNYNNALTGEINGSILGALGSLAAE